MKLLKKLLIILTPVVKIDLEETNDLPETIRAKMALDQQVNEPKVK